MVAVSLQAIDDVAFSEASNGLEAIEILARETINLMILDLNMPDMHGLEVLQFVRTHKLHGDIPVIVLTTKYDPETRRAALEGGASRYVTKPFDPAALRENAKSLLGAE
jgi:two-component system chemotaxis response regulator CheY